jgi:hypothetical protein
VRRAYQHADRLGNRRIVDRDEPSEPLREGRPRDVVG